MSSNGTEARIGTHSRWEQDPCTRRHMTVVATGFGLVSTSTTRCTSPLNGTMPTHRTCAWQLAGTTLLEPDEYPTLLPDRRFTQLSIREIQDIALDRFPGDPTRCKLFKGLHRLLSELVSHRITGELWIDGSFMTKKVGPSDIECRFESKGD